MNSKFDKFHSIIVLTFLKSFPLKKKEVKKYVTEPTKWWHSEWECMRNHLHTLYDFCKSDPNTNLLAYKNTFCREYRSAIELAKKRANDGKILSHSN